jgi:uncharacterized protein (TIGR02996 family)
VATEADFLRAICERPEDEFLRLVFADGLDDNGRPERAEFIRLQCELEKLGPARPVFYVWGAGVTISPKYDAVGPPPTPAGFMESVPQRVGFEMEVAIPESDAARAELGSVVDVEISGVAPYRSATFLDCVFCEQGPPEDGIVRAVIRSGGPPDPHREKRAALLERMAWLEGCGMSDPPAKPARPDPPQDNSAPPPG